MSLDARALTLVALLSSAVVLAQDVPVEPPAQSGETPTHSGRRETDGAIGQAGAILELTGDRGRPTLTLPPGLPIGSSRILSFAIARQRPQARQIHERFVRFGPTLTFSGAINATRTPLVLTYRSRRQPTRRGMKLILAVEKAGFCTEENQQYSLGSGLCSTWEIVETTFDEAAGLVRAEIGEPGGRRLQLGWIPDESTTE